MFALATSLRDLWAALVVQPAVLPHGPLILLVAVLVTMLMMSGNVWYFVRLGITWCHEGGHALAALMLGGRPSGIRVFHTTAGRTTMTMPAGSPWRSALVSFAGYPAPSLVGLTIAWFVSLRHPDWSLLAAVAIALASLVLMRSVVGVIVTVVIAASCVGLLFLPGSATVWFLVPLSVLLLIGGLRSTLESIGRHARGELGREDLAKDVRGVAERLRLPAPLVDAAWLGIWLICAMLTASLLLPLA